MYEVFSCEGRSILSGLKDFAPYRKTDIKKKNKMVYNWSDLPLSIDKVSKLNIK